MSRYNEAEILATWSHVNEGTLIFETEGKHANKQTVEIRTRDIHGEFDGQTRRIATSDLFQCYWTEDTKAALDSAKRSAKRQLKTKNSDAAAERMRDLDSMFRAQVELCKVDIPRIEKAREELAKAEASLQAVEGVKVAAEAKPAKAKATASEAAADLGL